ncbi:MAG: hypothetical protein SPJ27_04305 [Candidatus Onthovivens sp.]|nr:hypothetical protein [Candidatus Onthovivens sp.]
MILYYDFPEKEDYGFEITPDRFRDYIESQYSKSDFIELVTNFYWNKFDEEDKKTIEEETDFNPLKPHESDYEAYDIFIDYVYDFEDDFEDGLYQFYKDEAHSECVDDLEFKKEFNKDDRTWY